MKRRLSTSLALASIVSPSVAFASTDTQLVSQIAGLFYIIVGLALVASFLLMGAGLIMWIVRLGTDQNYRDEAVEYMEWSVATLFTLILVLGVVEFVQTHTSQTLYILSIVFIGLLIWLVLSSGLLTGGGEEKKEH